MKYMKAASALAVSMIAAGAAAGAASPAGAAEHSMSLNSGVQQLADALNRTQPVDSTVQPLLKAASETTQAVNEAREGDPSRLLSGAVDTAEAAAPLVGGMPLGG
ncbi:hypothetical protein [Streptomyces hypolithicus]